MKGDNVKVNCSMRMVGEGGKPNLLLQPNVRSFIQIVFSALINLQL